jgi:RNA polymerase sigma factor (sigma-70 family)
MNSDIKNFNQILKDFPPIRSLSKIDEQKLANSSRPCDKQTLVLGFMREAFVYSHRCSYGNIEPAELISLCYTALVTSARLFRPDEQRFFPYAKPNLRGCIYRYWRSNETVRHAVCVPFDIHAGEDAADGISDGAVGYIPATSELTGTDFDHGTVDLRDRMALVKGASGKLSPRESMVLELSYIGGYSFSIIGAMLKPRITRSAVSLLHRRAIKKIRCELIRKGELFS